MSRLDVLFNDYLLIMETFKFLNSDLIYLILAIPHVNHGS
jgi:hypothetical protein